MIATDLATGMANFDPAPLEFEDGGTAEFYVARDDEPLKLLRTQLISGRTRQKFLLAGHRGSGKSTELNRLSADPEIRGRYEVIKFSVKNVLDVTDLSHIDLLFTAVSLTWKQLVSGEDALDLDPTTVDRLDSWRHRVEEKIATRDESAGAEASGGAKLSLLGAFFAGFTGRLRVEQSTRKVTREIVEPRLSEFLETLDLFFQDVEVALGHNGRALLLVIEDLDKIPDIAKAIELFHQKGSYLVRPSCRIIFTVPIALHYSKEFQAVSGTFGTSVLLPNVALHEREAPEKRYDRGWKMMESFIAQRLDTELIEADALKEAVAASGGIFQQLQRLMEHACTGALAAGLPAITVEEIRDATADFRNAFERTLASEDYSILEEVSRTQQAASDEATLRLLHSLHLVEYKNRDRWCDLNPLLGLTLERWYEAHPGAVAANGGESG